MRLGRGAVWRIIKFSAWAENFEYGCYLWKVDTGSKHGLGNYVTRN